MSINLSGRTIRTESRWESEQLLKIALAQGFKLEKPERILEEYRCYQFLPFPINTVVHVDSSNIGANSFKDLFGDEEEELINCVKALLSWQRAHGYNHLTIHCNDQDDSYHGKVILKPFDEPYAKVKTFECEVPKAKKVTMQEIEAKFGVPIEIIA